MNIGSIVRFRGPSPECVLPIGHGFRWRRHAPIGRVVVVEDNHTIEGHDVGVASKHWEPDHLTWARIDELEVINEWGASNGIEARTKHA